MNLVSFSDYTLVVYVHLLYGIVILWSEVGIYKRKQESKNERKNTFDKEIDQEKKKHTKDQEIKR